MTMIFLVAACCIVRIFLETQIAKCGIISGKTRGMDVQFLANKYLLKNEGRSRNELGRTRCVNVKR